MCYKDGKSVIIIGLLILIGLQSATLIAAYLMYKRSTAILSRYRDFIADFFTPESSDRPSDFGRSIDAISDSFAQKIGVTVQAAIRGSSGGSSKALNRELEAEAIAENPSLAVVGMLPKSLRKNPLALAGLQALASKLFSSSGAGTSGPGTSNNGQTKFNL
jgi:hypothetical protein